MTPSLIEDDGPLFLGIDLGTSSVKALVVDSGGHVIGQGSAGYPILAPVPTYAEQDPEAWWQATIDAVRRACGDLQERTDPESKVIAAIAVTGQMHGTVLLDEAGHLLAPAIIWPDQRSYAEVAEITAQIGAEKLIAITGSPLATGFQAATLRWLHRHRPELWLAIRHILLPKDYLRWRMTGRFATDPSDASGTLLFDGGRRQWASELLDLLQIDPAWLPALQPSTQIDGELRPAAAVALGLSSGLPVVTGAADTPCSALAAGISRPDTLLITLSSGGQLLVPSPTLAIDRKGRIHTFCHALEASSGLGWYQMAALLNVGLVVSWLRDKVWALDGPDANDQLSAWAGQAPLGAMGLLFLPYLNGERSPYMNPHARGMWMGLSADHGRAEMTRAVFEGITLACYNAYRALEDAGAAPSRIVLAGGGANSLFWRQLIADVFGRPLHPLAISAQSALGAALLAGAATGHFDLLATAQTWAITAAPISPDLERHSAYRELLPRFRQAYTQNIDLWPASTHSRSTPV